MGGKKPLRRPLWPPTRATASNYYPLGLDGAGGAAKPLLRAPKKPAPLHGRLPAFSGAVDAFERARKCFLEWRYFFSIILSEFLKNRVALHLHMKVALSVPHTEKIEKFMFAKKVIRQKENGEFQPIHRAGLLNLADYEIVEQYNAEARGLCNYYNLACDYHTLDYFCYLMEYSCLKTIANKHKTSIRKIIRQYKDGKTWSVPYETKAGTKRVRPVKIADCKRGEASDIIYQRKKFSWKTTIRQRLNARVCELCGCKEADLYEVHVIRNLNELGNSDWETVMKKKRRKTLVVCSKCHERIHRH